MDNNDNEAEKRLRQAIREAHNSTPARKTPVGVLLALLTVALLVPPLAFLAYLMQTEEFSELGEFLKWLFDCMGADCP